MHLFFLEYKTWKWDSRNKLIHYRYLGIIGSVRPTMRDIVTSENKETNCANMNFLSEDQRKLCGKERRLPKVISDGASLGIQECKHQFANRRWNCSTYNSTDVFGGILKKSRFHFIQKYYIYILWYTCYLLHKLRDDSLQHTLHEHFKLKL